MGDDILDFQRMLMGRFENSDQAFLDDPAFWVRSNGEEVWSKQEEILKSVRDNRYTAVHSAHDLGKSFIASRAIAWWISCHPPGSAFVVSTAPSAAQVSAIMWREVGKIHRKADLIGKINRAGYPQWYIDGELVGYGRKPADYEQSAFQGIHAEFVLIVIDEACGVAQHLYDAVDSLATNENARVLAIGNPDDPASHFAKVCQPDSGWNVIHLDGLRSPNITRERVIGPDPANPKWPLLATLMDAQKIPYSEEKVPEYIRPLLVNEQWIEERIERWASVSRTQAQHILDQFGPAYLAEKVVAACEGSSLFTAKVRGQFPTSATDGVIPLGWVQRAIERWHDQKRDPNMRHPGNFVLGVDVARTGDDETCFAHRYGSYVSRLDHMRVTDTTVVADRAAAFLHEPRSLAVVDMVGIGAGVFDLLRRYKREGIIVGEAVAFNAPARTEGRRDTRGQFKFLNDRAAAWWNLRELLDPAFGSNIALPDDEAMVEELIAPKYDFNVGGTLKVESKEDIKRRIGRSTDSADAVIQAFWVSGDNYMGEFEAYDLKRRDGGFYRYEGFEDDIGSGLSVTNLDFTDL